MIYDRFTCPDAPLSPPEESSELCCPRCGAVAAKYVITLDGEIVGCRHCLEEIDAEKLEGICN